MADKYTTIQGDTFESVAWKTCGRSGAMWELDPGQPALYGCGGV